MLDRTALSKSLAGFALALLGAVPAQAATVYLSSTGVDTLTCGAADAPCRSFRWAIINASAGDTISVGPGRYGDLDNDGNLAGPGEEVMGAGLFGDCMIEVNKQVTIVSSYGAASTVIDPGPSAAIDETVCLTTAGITVGAAGKGFTVLQSNSATTYGITGGNVASDTVVAGNILVNSSFGTGVVLSGPNSVISGNRAFGGFGGFSLGNSGTITGNAASSAVTGFLTTGSGVVFSGNVANGNGVGLNVYAGSATITKSSFMGNSSIGIWTQNTATATVSGSNMAGNGQNGGNCGTQTDLMATLNSTANWWGDAAGPGAEPADLSCGAGTISNAENATSLRKIKVKGIR